MNSDPQRDVDSPVRGAVMISGSVTPREQRLSQAIDEYYAAVDAGHSPDRQRLLEKYADIAGELQECLCNLDFIRQVSPQLSAVDNANVAADAEGTVAGVLGDFRILQEIGRGGMGVVYEAEQISLGRRVALKVLPFASMLDQQQLARFKNEARAAATLKHPHIVSVYSVGSERGVHYYAMELIEGHSLADLIVAMRQGRPATALPLP